MGKEDPYSVKFEKLQPWVESIFHVIKKELKNDHLLKTPSFVQKYFFKRSLDRLGAEELATAYVKEIAEGDEELGEKIVTRWVMKNGELYQFFVVELSKINPQFDEIESLSKEVSASLLNASVAQFGASRTYIFCVMNAVVLSEEELFKLREMALLERAQLESKEENRGETVESVREHHGKEMRKLTEKYEKRVQGIEHKYMQDVAGLKKQIAQLHKRMGEKSVAV